VASQPEPPSFDGPQALADPALFLRWLEALRDFGVAQLRGLASRDRLLEQIVTRIGPVRESNFGRMYTLKIKDDPDSNAFTPSALLQHMDMPTRESAHGPIFETDATGQVTGVRFTAWLRAPLQAPLDVQARAYRSVRALTARAQDPAYQTVFAYQSGDLLAFDNRRAMHGRRGYDACARRAVWPSSAARGWHRPLHTAGHKVLTASSTSSTRAEPNSVALPAFHRSTPWRKCPTWPSSRCPKMR